MKKIVIIGPESTGKSTLCTQLAQHFETIWCPEYAREYLSKINRPYTYNDLLAIAKGQVKLEDALLQKASNGKYFIDTDMYVMKVWCEVAFQQCHTWILREASTRQYHLYLLCDADLPWEKDELREYPDLEMRKKLVKMYKDIVINSGLPWVMISGTDAQRLQTAIAAVDLFFKK